MNAHVAQLVAVCFDTTLTTLPVPHIASDTVPLNGQELAASVAMVRLYVDVFPGVPSDIKSQ
jgi:hypothetical protein